LLGFHEVNVELGFLNIVCDEFILLSLSFLVLPGYDSLLELEHKFVDQLLSFVLVKGICNVALCYIFLKPMIIELNLGSLLFGHFQVSLVGCVCDQSHRLLLFDAFLQSQRHFRVTQ